MASSRVDVPRLVHVSREASEGSVGLAKNVV
jgi:hypothetical protein